MSTRDALQLEIQSAPESILRETYDFLMFLKNRNASQDQSSGNDTSAPLPPAWPDFVARLKAIYGDRQGNDSQATMDYLRGERF